MKCTQTLHCDTLDTLDTLTIQDNIPPNEAKTIKSNVPDNGNKGTKKFRLAARNLFLTFPNVEEPFTTTQICDSLVHFERNKGLIYACISQETHQDGTPHFHIVASYEVKRQISKHTYFNFLCNKQGNYSGIRDLRSTILYTQKHDNFLE